MLLENGSELCKMRRKGLKLNQYQNRQHVLNKMGIWISCIRFSEIFSSLFFIVHQLYAFNNVLKSEIGTGFPISRG